MLELHFINVGDGDATLVEYAGPEGPWRLLVDTGREDVGVLPGSLRLSAADYLRQKGVRRLDALIITHLHIDHFGGLARLLDEVEVGRVISGFFPRLSAGRIARTGAEEKTVRGLLDCLERWAEDVKRLTALGVPLCPAEGTLLRVPAPAALRVEAVHLDPEAGLRQRQAWEELLSGGATEAPMVWWSAKYRNPGSLRVGLTYAGRRAELAGDCYGAAWEDAAQRCDILKVPHHGDAKSVTPLLAARLRPAHAVISCSGEYIPKKDRPSQTAIRLLEEQGTKVWFTDRFAPPGQEARDWTGADFVIREDGSILSPEERNVKRECAGGQYGYICTI